VTERFPGRIRIVAGAKRGHHLKVASMRGIRPTSEKVREAIFAVLGPVEGLVVLDLFAGTGALGLEALSRGARSCVFVEETPAVAEALTVNIARLGYESLCRVMVRDYREALGRLLEEGWRTDLLFVDPPYRILAEVEVALEPLLPSLLTDDGVVITEGDSSTRVTFGQPVVFERVYGATRVTMISNRGSTP